VAKLKGRNVSYISGALIVAVLLFVLFMAVTAKVEMTVVLESPVEKWTSYNNSTLNFTFTFFGPKKAACTLYIDGNATGYISAKKKVSTSIQASTSYSEGNHTWNITCVSKKKSASNSSWFFYDKTGPDIVWIGIFGPNTSFSNNSTITGASNITAIVNVTDNGKGVDSISVSTTNGTCSVIYLTPIHSGYQVNITCDYSNITDTVFLTLSSHDLIDIGPSNNNTSTQKIVVDHTLPELRVISPTEDKIEGNVTFNVSVRDYNTGVKDVTLNGKAMSLYEGDIFAGYWTIAYDTTLLTKNGNYDFCFIAEDYANNSNTICVTKYVENNKLLIRFK